MRRVLRVLAIPVLALGLGSTSACFAAPLRAEDLFRASELDDASFSPDGRYLGTIVTDKEDHRNLLLFDTREHKPLGLRASGDFDFLTFDWLGSDRVVFSVRNEKMYSLGLFSARIADLDEYVPINSFDVTEVIGIPRDRPGHLLVWVVKSWRSKRPGPLLELNAALTINKLDAFTTQKAAVRTYRPPPSGPVIGWVSDRNGELALCATVVNGGIQWFSYAAATDSWSKVVLPVGSRLMGVDYDNRFLWVATVSPTKAYELRRYGMMNGRMDEPVLTDTFYDFGVGRLVFSEHEHALAGVEYDRRKPFSAWFLRSYAVAQATVDKAYPNTDNILVANDAADGKFLFSCGDAEHPPTFVLLDLDARTLTKVDSAAPWLTRQAMCRVVPMGFRTRDGVRLEGYEAIPDGAGPDHPVPLVVLAHGGPWARDRAVFNPEVQFLVSRGYAVLQPNYRGSIGYSPGISDDDNYDFRRMHDDVTDATRAMLATGIIDPKRVAIMGTSFGGYLAVSGVAFEKDLYRCAITISGVFDWESLVESKRYVARPGEYATLTEKLGMPGPDNARLRAISPLEHADQIHVPVLIAHGTDDNIVDVAQSKRLARALKRQGVPCETFYRYNELHGFNGNYNNRVEFYHRVEAFLAANLGGETLTPP
jgi:acetyl esterase/lipase